MLPATVGLITILIPIAAVSFSSCLVIRNPGVIARNKQHRIASILKIAIAIPSDAYKTIRSAMLCCLLTKVKQYSGT